MNPDSLEHSDEYVHAKDSVTVEEHLVQSDPYYAAHPRPCIMPMWQGPLHSSSALWTAYKDEDYQAFVDSTLQQHGIARYSHDGHSGLVSYPNEYRRLPCIGLGIRDGDPSTFPKVAKAIYEYIINVFGKEKMGDFLVEVYNHDKMNDFAILPCPSPVVEQHNMAEHRTQAFEKAIELLRPNLISCGCYLMHESSPTSPLVPTIGLRVKIGAVADFRHCTLQITEIGKALGSAAQIRFIRSHGVEIFASPSPDSTTSESVGTVNRENPGLLGGYMMLTKEDQQMPVLVTTALIPVSDASQASDTGISNNRMDWALVEVKDTTTDLTNTSPDQEKARVPSGQFRGTYKQRGCDYVGKLKADQWLIMKGRQETFAGHTNGSVTEIAWGGQPCKTFEWEVFSNHTSKGWSSRLCRSPFGAEDDAGLWLYNHTGAVVGMYWGNLGGLGLVTSMRDIIKDVERRTGGELALLEKP